MEEWRDVPGRPGYLVSNEGRAAKLMHLTPTGKGYIQYAVPNGVGGRHREYLHSWVMLAFVGPRPEGMWILHRNDIKNDNRLENLRYGTPSENMEDSYLNGIRGNRPRCKFGHVLRHPNLTFNGKCRACKIARDKAARWQVPCTQPMRDDAYRELME
jgi:hypothetical protein